MACKKKKKINKTREHPSAVFFCFCLFLVFCFANYFCPVCSLIESISPIWCMMSAEGREKNCSYLKYKVEALIFSLELVGHSYLERQDEQSCLQSPFLTSVMEGFLAWSFYTAAVFTI